MNEIVTSYPPHIHRVEPPSIEWTAFYPGGSGLYCGLEHFAPAPEAFSDSPAMIVAHNYAGLDAYKRLRAKGGESGFWWRDIVIPLLSGAGIDPNKSFFTNALMGLKDGASVGNMNATKEFEDECSEFLLEQIRIVKPSVIIAFGQDAFSRVKRQVPNVARCVHPSAREFVPLATRSSRVSSRANELRATVESVQDFHK